MMTAHTMIRRNEIPYEQLAEHPEYVALTDLQPLTIELRYNSNDNFIGHDLYGDLTEAYLHIQAAQQLQEAMNHLQALRPGWRLRVFDALRPGRVQQVLWDHVKDTPSQIYVANPERGSIHSFGMAIDLTIEDEHGRERDMGTGFDDFTERAQPQKEQELLHTGRLTKEQLANRQLLRHCMNSAGFHGIPTEWWHFEAAEKEWVRANMLYIE